MAEIQSFVGLEIHVQLKTNTKVFCGCKVQFGDEPNTNVCPVCMGLPGSLPALNEEAMRKAFLVAKALNCTLTQKSMFERKNYFYPDLPKNYQISQFASPVGTNGYIDIEVNGESKRVRIHECHLEEDAGKMIHAGDMSLVDYNRTGTALLEIVTEPDMALGEEAEQLIHELRRIVRYLEVSDGNMDEGSMRADANVSVNWEGKGLGQKVEVKNLNSSRFVRKSLTYEIDRQSDLLKAEKSVSQETRLWNENRDQTEIMRTKENANDYRYFPEPDLPPFEIDEAYETRLGKNLVELPLARKIRLEKEYSISAAQAEFICEERRVADYFESVVKQGADSVLAATWLSGDVQKQLNRTNQHLLESPLTAERFSQMLQLLKEGTIHGKIAKTVLSAIFDENKDPSVIIKEKGLEQISDESELKKIIGDILSHEKKAVDEYKSGVKKAKGYLMGQTMKATAGRAEPSKVQKIMEELLQS